MIEIVFISLAAMVFCWLMIFKPMTCAKFIGNIYWHMSKYTALGKTEESKKVFFAKNPFWFRTYGIVLAVMYAIFMAAKIKELM